MTSAQCPLAPTGKPATVLVTAPKLAQAGVDILQAAGVRIIYLPQADDVHAVRHIMANRSVGCRGNCVVPYAEGRVQAWRGRQQYRCGGLLRTWYSCVRDAGCECAIGGGDDVGLDVCRRASYSLDG